MQKIFFFESQIKDDKVESQPELSYTQEETKELVQELINSLSEEQRMCILMFHIEDMSIKEIAETLECSENTVKSRLNYGRKNLKAKAEELEKKGCKLYGMAPIPLLLYLVRAEGAAFLPEAEVAKLLKFQNFIEYFNEITGMMQQTGGQLAAEQAASGVGKLAKQTAGAAGKAAKQTFLHTVAGKITVGAAAMLMITGVVATIIHNQSSADEETAIVQNSDEDIEEASQNEETEQDVAEETTEENTEYKQAYLKVLKEKKTLIQQYDWSNRYFEDGELLQGEVFPVAIADVTGDEVPELIFQCMKKDSEYEAEIEIYSVDDDGNAKMIFSEAWDVFAAGGEDGLLFKIEGSDSLYFYKGYGDEYFRQIYMELTPDENGMLQSVEFLNLYENYADDRTEYIFREKSVDKETALNAQKELLDKVAVVYQYNYVEADGLQEPGVEQKYMTYEDALRFLGEEVNEDENQQSTQAWKAAYIEVLEDPVSWLRDTQNVDADLLEELSDYEYTLFDINQDETPELIIHAGIPATSVYCFFCTFNQEKGVYMVSNLTKNFRHSLVVCDGQLGWYYYIPLGYAGEETRLTGGIGKFEMTSDEVTYVSIYSGVMEYAPETQNIELYSIEDTKAIEDY